MKAGDAAATAETAAERPVHVPGVRNPDGTRRLILEAATEEFARAGFAAARVNAIAERAGVNKRMLYHYYGDKDALFLAVLEATYERIRGRENALDLVDLAPRVAMRKLVETTWDHYVEHPEFISLLNSENLDKAAHLHRSSRARSLNSPLVEMIATILARGAATGEFRDDVDPLDLYISIAGLGYFYLSNRFTLSAVFGRDLMAKTAMRRRRKHIVDVVMGYLRPE